MMKKLLCLMIALAAALAFAQVSRAAQTINGAGATFPYPLYSKWAYLYNKETGVRVNYQSIGSGGGIRQIKAETVDFGASDAPLTPEELDEAGLMQFPMAVGGVVPVVNLRGVAPGSLKLTPELLAGIYLGDITAWDDERIASVNPGVKLPERKITVVHRSDGSGTTWIFTNYLYKTSSEWKDRVGFGKAVDWPSGVGGKGNEGVATYVKRIKGAIGYVEYAYALQNKLTHVKLKNRSGAFVEPSMETFSAAAAGAEWKDTPGFSVVLTDQAGEKAWPIAGATFILVHEKQDDCATVRTVLKFFDWTYREGAEVAEGLDYVPIPEDVYTIMENAWAERITCSGEKAWK